MKYRRNLRNESPAVLLVRTSFSHSIVRSCLPLLEEKNSTGGVLVPIRFLVILLKKQASSYSYLSFITSSLYDKRKGTSTYCTSAQHASNPPRV
mmetsp:Transcript_2515/g.4002  ORF Transcript_2515/g.4002 Transcript_2515/m.4002 type:complete len:94 (+) Transcript_2515:53-334(+)